MDHLDGFVGATEFAEVFDLAEEDAGQLVLAELELTARIVVSHSNGASCHRDLHHAAVHLGDRLGLHGLI